MGLRSFRWLALACTWLAPSAFAAVNILATVPEWGALAEELGGDKVKVSVATTAMQDPHHVEARPSLIARTRTADLVIATGAELEAGWLPMVVQQAGNPKVREGQRGYLAAAALVPLLDKPARLDRAEGDVHASGNPHIQTDPRNIARVATALAAKLAEIDPPNAEFYRSRHAAFASRWSAAIAQWEKDAAPLRGVKVVVQHKGFPYLFDWLGIQEVGALEPKPGIEPTTAHLSQVLATIQQQPVKMVIRAAYQSDRASQWVAERAKVRLVTLAFTVGGTEGAKDLFSLYGDTVSRLLKGLQ
jgi:zinc/manganese transport system substrate-binding protein